MHERPEKRPSFAEIAEQLDQIFKQLIVQDKSVSENKGYLKDIEDTNVAHSQKMKAQYVDMKSQNRISRKKRQRDSTIRKLNSLDETDKGVFRKKDQTYVNAGFVPTEPKNDQPVTEDDFKLKDKRLYTSMCHETPLLDGLSASASPLSQIQRSISFKKSSSQDNLDKAKGRPILKTTQSCNPLYMVMDQLERDSKESLNDHKRNTICYL